MSASYYIRSGGGAPQGPFAVERIRGYIEQQRVTREMEFSTDGVTWVAGAEVPGLFPPVAPAAPERRRARGPAAAPSPRRAKPPRSRAASRSTPRAPEEPTDRIALSRAIATARQHLRAVRGLLIVDALLVGVALVFILWTDVTWLKVSVGLLLVSIVLSAVFVVRFPVACTTFVAVYHTLVAVLSGGRGLGGALNVGLVFVAWGAVGMARSLQAVLRKYPDALAVKHLRGEQLGSTEAGTRWRDRAREDKAAHRKWLALYVGLPLVLAIGAVVVLAGQQGRGPSAGPPTPQAPLEPQLEAFRAAWNGEPIDAISAFFAEHLRRAR